MDNCLLEIKNVSKKYYGNSVLTDVSLTVNRGEIHALIGENGAGKSTLMNILFGMPVIHSTGGFEGSILIDGKKVDILSPFDAMNLGIGMVHQEFMLIPDYTITENIKLNREIVKNNALSRVFSKQLSTLDRVVMAEDARKALDILSMDIEEFTKVGGLPIGHMQFIEIAREIDKHGIKILVFDEPTAVLTESEANHLLDAMKHLASTGIGILFISHRLDEILHVADRVTILRDGNKIATKDIKETNAHEIARLMVGRNVSIERVEHDPDRVTGDPILTLKNFCVDMPGEEVKGIDLSVREGEILGIGGLAGQGKLGIANGIMGLQPSIGEVIYNGKELNRNTPLSPLLAGLAFVSEDRKGIGLLLDESIEMNIVFTQMQMRNDFMYNLGFTKFRNAKKIRTHAKRMIEELDIRCTSPLQSVGRLSGGNQQKVCLARALTQKPKLLLVSEPTRGIDIGAKKLILDLLLSLNKKHGMTVIMTSSELAELKSICDRIVIISEGKVAGELGYDADDAVFGLMMSGGTKHLESAR